VFPGCAGKDERQRGPSNQSTPAKPGPALFADADCAIGRRMFQKRKSERIAEDRNRAQIAF
jgi:hypothetical protein